MCEGCWNVDVMEKKLKSGDLSCIGEDMLQMTVAELKTNVEHLWNETGQTEFRVFSESVPACQKDRISWNAIPHKGIPNQTKITVSFISQL